MVKTSGIAYVMFSVRRSMKTTQKRRKDMDLIQIGKFMAALRKEQGYTQEQLAAADSRAGSGCLSVSVYSVTEQRRNKAGDHNNQQVHRGQYNSAEAVEKEAAAEAVQITV